MGNIRDSKIKKYAQEIVAKYPDRVSLNFDENKKLLEDICIIYGKKVRNQIAGYIVCWLQTKDNTYENIKRELYENKNKRKRQIKEGYMNG